jgi:P27 family predicted phage terminase small subunit
MVGRPAKPVDLHKLAGTYREDRHGGKGCKLPAEAPGCPEWLSREAKAEWRRVVPELEAYGQIAKVDRGMLSAYCEAWAEFVSLSGAIEDCVKADKKGGYAAAIQAGLVNAKNSAVKRMLQLAAQIGLSPVARARLKSSNAPEKEDSGKARFFGGPSAN